MVPPWATLGFHDEEGMAVFFLIVVGRTLAALLTPNLRACDGD